MPIIFIVLAAMLFGAYKLYTAAAGAYGVLAGMLAILAAAAAVVAATVWGVRRHRALHGRTVNGQRLLQISGDWGQLTLNAEGRRAHLRLHGNDVDFIFGDIANAVYTGTRAQPAVILHLQPTPQHELRIPMPNAREGRRWAAILKLAQERVL